MKYEEVCRGYANRYREMLRNHQSLIASDVGDVRGVDASVLDKLWEVPFCNTMLLPFLLDGGRDMLQLFCEDAEDISDAYSALSSVRMEADRAFRDSGSWDLAFGYPFLEGTFQDGTKVRAPVFLFPVTLEPKTLESGKRGWAVKNLQFSHASINESLIRGFELFHHEQIPPRASMSFPLSKGIRGLGMVEIVQSLFKGMNLQHVPGGHVSGEIEPFTSIGEHQPGTIMLQDCLVLGFFPQKPAHLSGEYARITDESCLSTTAERILDQAPEEGEHPLPENHQTDENRAVFLTPLDSSQERAVQACAMGHNIAVQGAPGTGKTQVQANIIGDCLMKGRRVLVVSQKRSSLDDLYARLADSGIGSYALLMQNPVRDRIRIIKALSEAAQSPGAAADDQWEHESEKLKNRNLELSHEIEKQLSRLNAVKHLLHEQTPSGLELIELYRRTSRRPDMMIPEIIDDPGEYGTMGMETLQKFDQLLDAAVRQPELLLPDHPAAQRKSFAHAGPSEQQSWRTLIDAVQKGMNRFQEQRESALSQWASDILAADDSPRGRCSSLTALLSETRREIDASELLPADVPFDRNTLEDLVETMQHSHAWQPKFWKSLKKLKHFSSGKTGVFSFSRKLRYTLQIMDRLDEIADACSVRIPYSGKEGLSVAVGDLAVQAQRYMELFEVAESLTEFLQEKQVHALFADMVQGKVSEADEYLKNLKEVLEHQFDDMSLLDAQSASIGDAAGPALSGMVKHCGYSSDQIRETGKQKVMNSLHICQILHAEAQHSEVISFIEHSKEGIERTSEAMAMKQELVPRLIARRVEKAAADIMEKSWLPQQISAELGTGEKDVSLSDFTRKFLQEGLLDLMPCWLMTADAALTVTEASQLFDLVIFDEASLITVSEALPVMCRGKQIAVFGDDALLHPADADDPSLLSAADSLETVRLKHQYRCIDERLFAFQNAVSYGGKICSVPCPWTAEPPIELVVTSSQAEGAVETLRKILKSRKDRETIGIITWTESQQQAVSRAVNALASKDGAFRKACRDERERTEGFKYQGLFIRRAEDVQGWTRDIIILLAGDGDALPHDKRGRHLLNTVLTRASKKLFVISPEAESTGSDLFDQFLAYVKTMPEGQEQLQKVLKEIGTIEEPAANELTEAVHHELIQRGLQVHACAGCSPFRVDLAVYDSSTGRYVLGILCGECSGTARQSIIHRRTVLESRGWRILTLWSRDWWLEQDTVIQTILDSADTGVPEIQ